MSMPKKEHVVVNCKIDKEMYDKLVEICNKTGLSKTKAIERAIKVYADEYEKTGKS